MQPEDILILGVAGVVALNRGFSGTGLRRSNVAYVIIQVINLAACVALYRFRLDAFPPQLDFWVRVFLTLFVGWQMVNNNMLRARLRRTDLHEAQRARERQRRLDAIHAEAEGGPEP